jgi:ribosome-associated translation inhibitor RaiA
MLMSADVEVILMSARVNTHGSLNLTVNGPTQENDMQIQINSDQNVEGLEVLTDDVIGIVESALNRFSKHITRVEVHLSDENSDKKAGYKAMRCMMEARLENRQPIAVTDQAETLDQAVDNAADQLARKIESTLGRLIAQDRQRDRTTATERSISE